MKHNFKLKERLGALLLAMLFILQAILGLVPVCVTQAAPLTVETWDSDCRSFAYSCRRYDSG